MNFSDAFKKRTDFSLRAKMVLEDIKYINYNNLVPWILNGINYKIYV